MKVQHPRERQTQNMYRDDDKRSSVAACRAEPFVCVCVCVSVCVCVVSWLWVGTKHPCVHSSEVVKIN